MKNFFNFFFEEGGRRSVVGRTITTCTFKFWCGTDPYRRPTVCPAPKVIYSRNFLEFFPWRHFAPFSVILEYRHVSPFTQCLLAAVNLNRKKSEYFH